tara:strand:+ start:8311 stop:8706 length:396 start_codon:yes stop_codon:yes gene_type:complete
MSKVGKAIYNILSNNSPVSSITTNISPLIVGQTVNLPAIIYRTSDNTPSDTKNGVSLLDEIMVEIEFIAETYSVVEDLSAKARTALDRYSGTANGVKIQSVQFTGELDSYGKFEDGLYNLTQTYVFRIELN